MGSEFNCPGRRFLPGQFFSIKADKINSQALANLLFDFHVHSGSYAISELQRAINDLSFPYKILVDGVMGPQTIGAANALDVGRLHDRYKARRKAFLLNIIDNKPSQKVFKAGWLARLSSFPDLILKKDLIISSIGLGLTIYGLYWFSKQ